MNLFGSIEAGGTKFLCAVGNEKNEIITSEVIPTTTYEQTIKQVNHFFSVNRVSSIAIGSFGPIDNNKNSDKYGYILNTPKQGWSNV
ncbi:fructokinase/branched chain amino acid--2-keto-4-methylthiobutyrate aminotransferase, partial [Gilliamella apicola]